MEIIYKNYKGIPEQGKFNLLKTKQRIIKQDTETHKKGEVIEIKIIMAYGISFERMVQRIIHEELANKKVALTLKQYIDEFKSLKQEILDCLK